MQSTPKLGAARHISWVAVLLGVIPVACSLTTHGDDYVEGGASGGAGTPGASGSSTASGVTGPGSTATTGASTTGGGGGATAGVGGAGGAGGASSASSSAESSSSSGGAGTGGAGGGPVSVCGNGIIEEGEECDAGGALNIYCVNCGVECGVYLEHPTTHHCYGHSGFGTSNWTQSQQNCFNAGGHLAALTTMEEVEFIRTNLPPPSSSWIGGTDAGNEGQFKWVTGEPWIFQGNNQPWDSGEPSGDGNCVEMLDGGSDEGELNDISCENARSYYCERPPPGMKL